jgi:hypothetical protein
MKESELEKFKLNDHIVFDELPSYIKGLSLDEYKALGKA